MNNEDALLIGNNGNNPEGPDLSGKKFVHIIYVEMAEHDHSDPDFKRTGLQRLEAKPYSIMCGRCTYSMLTQPSGVEACDVHRQLLNDPLIQVVRIWAMSEEDWHKASKNHRSMNQNYPRTLVLGGGGD